MGIFNRSIPTYTVDTANKLRITKPVVEEPEIPSYVDDAFDPILNQAVRARLLQRYKNPISATAMGYYELINNALVGQKDQWGPLGPGMGVLGTFGRTMDKAGDFIIGGITEGTKALTGQETSNPLYQVFVKDQDYTGGKLLAAMGNSMAKLAGAPELTEEDFGGAWKIPSIGLELATDPGILGGAMAKAGGAIGRASTSEVLSRIGKSGNSPLADVGQLLSNYDDAMAKIAIDVTAPGTRQAIKKFRNHFGAGTGHSSEKDYVNMITRAKTTDEVIEIVKKAKSDPGLKMQMDVNAAIKSAEESKQLESEEVSDFLEDLVIERTSKSSERVSAAPKAPDKRTTVTTSKTSKLVPKRFNVRKFTPSTSHTKKSMQSEFNEYVNDIRKVRESVRPADTIRADDYSELHTPVHVPKQAKYELTPKGKSDLELYNTIYKQLYDSEHDRLGAYMETSAIDDRVKVLADREFEKRTGKRPGNFERVEVSPAESVSKHVDVHRTSVKKYLKTKYKTLSPDDQLAFLIANAQYFNTGSKTDLLSKQNWFKEESQRLMVVLDKKYPVKTLPNTDVGRPLKVNLAKPTAEQYQEAVKAIRDANSDTSAADIDNAIDVITRYENDGVKFTRPFKERELNIIETAHDPDVASELKAFHADLTAPGKEAKVVFDKSVSDIVPYRTFEAPATPTSRLLDSFGNNDPDYTFFKTVYGMEESEARKYIQEYFDEKTRLDKYVEHFTKGVDEYRTKYYGAIQRATDYAYNLPGVNAKVVAQHAVDSESEAVAEVFRKLANDRDYAGTFKSIINEEYQLDWSQDTLYRVADFISDPEAMDAARRYHNYNGEYLSDVEVDDIVSDLDDALRKHHLDYDVVDSVFAYDIDTVDGFLKFIEDNVDGNTATYSTIQRLIEPYKQGFENAPISISPSTLYNARNPEVSTNAVAALNSRLKRIFKDYGFLDDVSDKTGFWDAINADPTLMQIFTPEWRVERYISELELMFKQQGLRNPLNNSRLRQNFFQEIHKYPKIAEVLNVKEAFISDLKESLFGEAGVEWLRNDKTGRWYKRPKYTVQQQLLAFDRLTQNIINGINPRALEEVSANANSVQLAIRKHGVRGFLERMRDIFPESKLGKYGVHLPGDYDRFIRDLRKTTLALVNGDLYSELYRFATDARKTIFNPLKLQGTGEGIAKSTLKFKDTGVANPIVKEFDSLMNEDATKELNALLRKSDVIHTIEDARAFAEVGLEEQTPLNEFVEVKFNNLGKLKLKGSWLPDRLRTYSALYSSSKEVPTLLYPIRKYLEGAKDAADLARRKKVLNLIVKASPEDTLESILKDVGGVDSDIKRLFTKTDLTPRYVQDIMYDYTGKTPISVDEELITKELSELPPKEIVNAPVVTAADSAVSDAMEAAGVSEVAEDVLKMTGCSGNFDDLSPEDVTKLEVTHGKDAIDLFKIINDSTSAVLRSKSATNTVESVTGERLTELSNKLSKDKDAARKLMQYDIVQTYERGDILDYKGMIDELATSDGIVGMHCTANEAATLEKSLADFTKTVNSQLGFEAFKIHRHDGTHGTFVAVMLNSDMEKKLHKADFTKLKFAEDAKVVFEAPKALPDTLKKFKESAEYADYDAYAYETSAYVRDIYEKLGFKYDDSPHIKHVLNDIDMQHAPLIHEFYTGLDLKRLKKVTDRLRTNESLKHLYGTFGVVPFGRGLRGNVGRYNFDSFKTFNFDPNRVLSSSLSEGVLGNSNVQGFVGLFVNDNFTISKNFDDVDTLIKTLNAGDANMRNLDVIAPVYDDTGKLIKFHRYNKMSRAELTRAYNNPYAILVPNAFTAPLDAWCKKNIKMSNKVYRFLNKFFMLPYKFGVLANPGFLLGNVSDAYLKQVTTLAQKYGTSVPEEIVNLADSMKEVIHLNNTTAEIYKQVLTDIDTGGVKMPPSERVMEALTLNAKARRRIIDYLNGNLKHPITKNVVECTLTDAQKDTLRLWMYLNTFQTTKALGEGVRDISTEFVKEEHYGIIERVFFGSKNYKAKKPSTWGVFANNPYLKAITDSSEQFEAWFRSANILNALKHEGYDANELARIISDGYDPALAQKLHVDTVNAMNVMYNSNFNYDMQSELMHKIGYAVPFPTFFVKNFMYWMEMLADNPQYIDHAITIQEGLWADRDEDVAEDKFMAEAKGRGAIPISDGDEQGLSKFFRGIYKPTPLNSMFSAFNLINNPIDNLTTRVHPMLGGPMQLAQAKLAPEGSVLATEPDDVKYRPYSFNRFERNVKSSDEKFNSLNYMFHRLNPFDRAIGNAARFPDKLIHGDVQLSDVVPSVFQPDF